MQSTKHETPRAREALLMNAVIFLMGLAALLPPLAQSPQFHEFADQRAWGGLPHALDVLSNLPFALWGTVGLVALHRSQARQESASRWMARLFFAGLLATAACSAWYHLAPNDASLGMDRLGMCFAFAGLMGLAAASHVSDRAGAAAGVLSLVLGLLSVWVWRQGGNLTPWAVYQFGGMALMLGLLLLPRLPGALPVNWLGVLLIYGVAKLLEMGDMGTFELTGWVSGHSLKHVVASFAAWPVIHAVQRSRSLSSIAQEMK